MVSHAAHRRWPLLPVPADRRTHRVLMLVGGLVVYAVGQSLLLVARLGVDPWNVLHQGLSRTFGGQVGTWSIVVGAIVLAGWLPLRLRPGVGTLVNIVLIGIVLDEALALLPTPQAIAVRIALMLTGVLLIAVATALYVGAGMGPGPRDGLMTGFAARGHSVRVVRTTIEVTVLISGWLLGGTVGIGTVLFATSIGPLVHVLLPPPAPRGSSRPQVVTWLWARSDLAIRPGPRHVGAVPRPKRQPWCGAWRRRHPRCTRRTRRGSPACS